LALEFERAHHLRKALPPQRHRDTDKTGGSSQPSAMSRQSPKTRW